MARKEVPTSGNSRERRPLELPDHQGEPIEQEGEVRAGLLRSRAARSLEGGRGRARRRREGVAEEETLKKKR